MSLLDYEVDIGLEVHAELKTKTKIFCACPTAFGAVPNTQCCPVCLGLPGALPTLNRHAVELAIKAGLALGCEISELSRTDRKQYFYPDLPKAYQISQDRHPLCYGGTLTVRTSRGERRIGITRIHIEEDAGKLIHTGTQTLVDSNRCGVPLVEIVTAPDMRSGEEAATFLRTLRGVLVACGISDCKMQEGSLRCDVNISLRKRGSSLTGVRAEIKNLNSFAFAEKAISYEIQRQYELLSRGESLRNETRRFDTSTGKTVLMRVKERAVDYRYLAEPDLPAIRVTADEIEQIRRTLPELPDARAARLVATYGVTVSDAAVLVSDPVLADYFESAAKMTVYPKELTNLLLTDLLHYCESDPFISPVPAEQLALLADLYGEGTINSSTTKKLLARLTRELLDLRKTVETENLAQIRNRNVIADVIAHVMEENPRAVSDYRNGKKAALRALQGKAMAATAGRADPILLETMLTEALQLQ